MSRPSPRAGCFPPSVVFDIQPSPLNFRQFSSLFFFLSFFLPLFACLLPLHHVQLESMILCQRRAGWRFARGVATAARTLRRARRALQSGWLQYQGPEVQTGQGQGLEGWSAYPGGRMPGSAGGNFASQPEHVRTLPWSLLRAASELLAR